ncbi:MAG TPA: alkaline phosphatase family protein, partial [Verrucomicrobiae bacterium]|nr:alkaline phosphatase family protein [Verrucomicrobiae bacterium]
VFLLLIGVLLSVDVSAAELKTRNVILITTDGFRWQELFTGADPDLLNKENGGVANPNALKKEFWRETPEARREALMPFIWNVIAKKGQIFGNQHKGSVVQITNDKKFSYPGYNEILTGWANSNITSNAMIPNPTPTVLEWLHNKPAFRNKVAVFSAWDVVPFIVNRDRCGFPVMGGWEPVPDKNPNDREKLLNDLISEMTRVNGGEVDDPLLFHAAMEHFLKHKPRVFMFGFLETDHWGHAGRYDNVLHAAHRVDQYIRRIWETVQSLPEYRDQTTLIITTDHGRGFAPVNWKHHDATIDGAENIWMAFLGPDTPALGERTDIERHTQNQIAATLAAFLGEDYHAAVPKSGPLIDDVFPKKNQE